MKKIVSTLLIFIVSFPAIAQDPVQRIDSLLQTYYKDGEPGAAVAIKIDGRLLFEKGYGIADLRSGSRITAKSNFNIGSITKQFTAYAILDLLKQHRLKLEDPLIRYFPAFAPTVGNLVTIRDLLTHSSGILDHYAYTDTVHVKHATDRTVLEAVQQIDSTYFPPGAQYRYSNTAYCLLAMIIEKITGKSYAKYMERTIFVKLGMKNSMIWQAGHSPSNRVMGYEPAPNNRFRELDEAESIFFSTEGDGGLYTSLDDYLKWWDGLQAGKVLDRSIANMARSAQFPVEPSKGLFYGFGWFVNKNAAALNVYHTGSNGGFRAVVFSIPAQNDLVLILSNRSDIELENIVIEINKILNINQNSYIKIDSLESFNLSCPNFAPCKKTASYSTSSIRNLNARDMVLN